MNRKDTLEDQRQEILVARAAVGNVRPLSREKDYKDYLRQARGRENDFAYHQKVYPELNIRFKGV